MARYAVVEGVDVTNVIDYDPDEQGLSPEEVLRRRLPAEIVSQLMIIPAGVPVEIGWTCIAREFHPPFLAPLPRQATDVEDLETQYADLQLQVIILSDALAELTDRVTETERRP